MVTDTDPQADMAVRNRKLGAWLVAAIIAALLFAYATRHVLYHVVFK